MPPPPFFPPSPRSPPTLPTPPPPPVQEARFGRLWGVGGGPPPQTFQEAFKQVAKNRDIKEDLEEFLDIFRRLNLEVIVVDQTSPVTKRNGLYCVKVLIPGMLPMTFGHRLTRLTGLERVLTVPAKLGYRKTERSKHASFKETGEDVDSVHRMSASLFYSQALPALSKPVQDVLNGF